MPTAMFQVPKVLEERGVTGDGGLATAMDDVEGLRFAWAVLGDSTKEVSVVVVLLESVGDTIPGPA